HRTAPTATTPTARLARPRQPPARMAETSTSVPSANKPPDADAHVTSPRFVPDDASHARPAHESPQIRPTSPDPTRPVRAARLQAGRAIDSLPPASRRKTTPRGSPALRTPFARPTARPPATRFAPAVRAMPSLRVAPPKSARSA